MEYCVGEELAPAEPTYAVFRRVFGDLSLRT